MSEVIRNKMIVLRKVKYKEADLIIQGITPDGGKISLLARAALRSKKRFGGGILEPTHHLEVHYKKPLREDLIGILDEAILLHDFKGLRQSYDRLEIGLKVVELVLRVSQEGDAHSEALYNLTGHALKSLESDENMSYFKTHFGLRFMYQQGVLEQEPWMQPFLQTPMGDTKKLYNILIELKHIDWVETQLERYLSR